MEPVEHRMPLVAAQAGIGGITRFPADDSFQPQESRVDGDAFMLHVCETPGVAGGGLFGGIEKAVGFGEKGRIEPQVGKSVTGYVLDLPFGF